MYHFGSNLNTGRGGAAASSECSGKKFLIPTQVDLALRITVGCRFDRLLSITYSCIFRHSKSSFAGKIYATCKGEKKRNMETEKKNEYKSVKLQFSQLNENWSLEELFTNIEYPIIVV